MDVVLVPGFEPGSTDRESVMMDRTTLHEPGYSLQSVVYQKHPNFAVSLSLSLTPLDR